MARVNHSLVHDEPNPIDIVEAVAEARGWDFDRPTDDQIALASAGHWRTYSLTLAWSPREQVLRLICAFDMDPPAGRLPALYEAMNLANDCVWDGGFTYWPEQRLMAWRYGLLLAGEQEAAPEQVAHMIRCAVDGCERFYPAFQLSCWGQVGPAAAIEIALSEAYGRA